MSIPQWELDIALGSLGLNDDQKATVEAALPVAAKLVNHVEDNKALFATLYADCQLLLPAAKILLDALNTGQPVSISLKRSEP